MNDFTFGLTKVLLDQSYLYNFLLLAVYRYTHYASIKHMLIYIMAIYTINKILLF